MNWGALPHLPLQIAWTAAITSPLLLAFSAFWILRISRLRKQNVALEQRIRELASARPEPVPQVIQTVPRLESVVKLVTAATPVALAAFAALSLFVPSQDFKKTKDDLAALKADLIAVFGSLTATDLKKVSERRPTQTPTIVDGEYVVDPPPKGVLKLHLGPAIVDLEKPGKVNLDLNCSPCRVIAFKRR